MSPQPVLEDFVSEVDDVLFEIFFQNLVVPRDHPVHHRAILIGLIPLLSGGDHREKNQPTE